jgi:U3 small nucleolar RNA-associated protein 14
MKRVEERMNLRHKNMSKWARMALEHSHQNKGLRDSYHEAVRLGNELSSKVNDVNEGDESGADSDGYNSNNDGENSILMSATNSVLDGYRETNSGVQGKYKKLFDMDFMKKAAMEQRQRGLEEAKNVLREIEDMENEIDSDDNNDVDTEKLSHKKSSSSVSFNKKSKDGSMLVGKNRVKTSFSIPDMNENNNNDDENTKYIENDNNTSTDNPWLSLDADIDKKTIKSNKSTKAKTDFVRVQQTKQQPEKVNKIAGRKQKEETETKETSEKTHKDEKANLKRKLTDEKSTVDMVNLAFAGPDYEAEFKGSKKQAIDQELGVDEKKMQILSQVKAGWGDWAGPGNNGVSKKTLAKRDVLLQQLEKDAAMKKKGRQDSKIMNVIISDRRIKTSAKFKISEIPHPFTSIAEYEQSLQVPIGPDWNSSQVVKKNTNPDVITRSGRVIEAIRLK